MKTVLIIGAAGFIGSHLCDKFLSEGFRVVGIDDLSTGNKMNLSQAFSFTKFSLLEQDISQKNCIRKISNQLNKIRFKPEIVVHLAAKKIPRYGKRLQTLIVNTEGTKNMLDLAVKFKSKFVFASTSDVYGMNPDLPFSEESNSVIGPSIVGRWAYAVSKMFDEQLVFAFSEEFKIPVVIVRIFGVYGPRQMRGWGGNGLSAFFEQAIENKIYELHGDGQQTRTFIYISDLIEGLMSMISSPSAVNQIINLGRREEITMKHLSKTIHQLINPGIKFRYRKVTYLSFTGRPYQDVRAKMPDISKARNLLKWSPSISLREGLKKTWEWYQSK